MTEKTTSLLNRNRYEDRLESTKALPGYDSLDDEQKTLLGYLAFDQDLDGLDFNEAVNGEIAKARARTMSGTALRLMERSMDTTEKDTQLPRSFQEAEQLRGHSIEDFVKTIDFDASTDGVWEALHRNYTVNLSDNETAFLSDRDNIVRHEKQLLDFARELIKSNPHQSERRVQLQQAGWLQLDSRDLIKSRIEDKSTDPVVARLYLNPELGSVMPIYRELFKRAEARGLRFKSKVLDYEIRNRPAEKQDQLLDYHSKETKKRSDPIVFYAFEDSKDELFEIVNDVYREYPSKFKGQATAAFPLEIAEGYAVGAEPEGLSGTESLSSHRVDVINRLIKRLSDLPKWSKLTNEQKQRAVAVNFRRLIADKQHINADNIAFNA
jgi:hypothetical protein